MYLARDGMLAKAFPSFRLSDVTVYAQGIVDAGFDGACPRMRCMFCPRVVSEREWAPLVEPEALQTFQKRAATLLTIQVTWM